MTTPDYRAALAAMSSWWGILELPPASRPEDRAAFKELGRQVRALLATPEAVGVTDEELDEWLQNHPCVGLAEYDGDSFAYPPITEPEMRRVIRDAIARYGAHPAPVPVATPGEEYHEDMGAVLWWRFPIDEPPYCGGPLDDDWPGYHTHFTPLGPMPELPEAQP
jgi:hypothetical protein